MDKRIHSFIDEQKNLTFCTSVNNQPYGANCFYAFVEEEKLFVFKSDKTTKHISDALINEKVAGTILPDISKTGTLRGIQYVGKFVLLTDDLFEKAKKHYYKKFPFATIVPGELWALELYSIKMTDNTLGFGKKLHWER